MAYVKQNFTDGQVLTAEHLNRMERGIAEKDVSYYLVSGSTDALTLENTNTETIRQDWSDSKCITVYRYVNEECRYYHCMGLANQDGAARFVFQFNRGIYYERILIAYDGSIIFESGYTPIAKIGNVTLLASEWSIVAENLYSQFLIIDGVTEHSKVDLLPSVEQMAIFHNKDVAFVTENEDGVVNVYAIGDKPLLDYTMQVQITEVEA